MVLNTQADRPQSVTEIMQNLCSDLFDLTPPERTYLSVESRAKEMPKICEILELDPATMKPKENPERNLTKRMATDKASLMLRVGM